VGCVFAMFIVNPTVSLVAVAVVISLYAFILRRGVHGRGDSRSGMFAAVAEWAATRATELASDNPRAWKPNLLVPVRDTSEVRGDFQFLHELARPEGTIKLLGIATVDAIDDVTTRMGNLTQEFRRKGVATTFSVIDSAAFTTGVLAGLQALRSAFFRPNILFHHLQDDSTPESDAELEELWLESRRLHVGLALLAEHPRAGLGKRSILHLWIPADVVELPLDRALTQGGLHLALLVGMRLHRMWGAEFRVVYALKDESQRPAAVAFAAALRDRARLSAKVDHLILVGNLEACMANAPQSDLDILGLPPEPDLEWVRKAVSVTRSACLFLGDSGKESGLA
jgi:solute carrier family 12 sodium/potassium/chloride transporter 2